MAAETGSTVGTEWWRTVTNVQQLHSLLELAEGISAQKTQLIRDLERRLATAEQALALAQRRSA